MQCREFVEYQSSSRLGEGVSKCLVPPSPAPVDNYMHHPAAWVYPKVNFFGVFGHVIWGLKG